MLHAFKHSEDFVDFAFYVVNAVDTDLASFHV